MQGIERAYCDVCVHALLEANQTLMETSVIEAISTATAYGKGDTLSLDAIPEIAIADSLSRFDPHAILITEELGAQQLAHRMIVSGREQPTLFFCDPTDRSAPLAAFLQKFQGEDPGRPVGEVLRDVSAVGAWEEHHGSPVAITGACAAITCVRDGIPIFSVLLNYITQEIVLVSNGGTRRVALPHYADGSYGTLSTNYILQQGTPIEFSPLARRAREYSDRRTFVTFLGKSGYRESFEACGIFSDPRQGQPFYDAPGGPARPFYLSCLFTKHPVGFILANGEKIVEWIHWLTAVRFAECEGERVLQLFEVTHERPWTKGGVSMAPSPAYSIFRTDPKGRIRLDARLLCNFERPSQFRSTLVVAPSDNTWLLQVMRRCQYREIVLD